MSVQRHAVDQYTTMDNQGETATEFLAENDVSPELASILMMLAPASARPIKCNADFPPGL
jgi:hypothetical protein